MYLPYSLLITAILPKIFADNATEEVERNPAISVVEFQNLLLTEFNNEVFAHETKNLNASATPRHLTTLLMDDFRYQAEEDVPSAIRALWNRLNQHGWSMAETLTKLTGTEGESPGYSRRRLQSPEEQHPYPFIICNRSPLSIQVFNVSGQLCMPLDPKSSRLFPLQIKIIKLVSTFLVQQPRPDMLTL
jgi:hypothetical protein